MPFTTIHTVRPPQGASSAGGTAFAEALLIAGMALAGNPLTALSGRPIPPRLMAWAHGGGGAHGHTSWPRLAPSPGAGLVIFDSESELRAGPLKQQKIAPLLVRTVSVEEEVGEADEDTQTRPAIHMNVSGGVQLLQRVPAPTAEQLADDFINDANHTGYTPYGRADLDRLRLQLPVVLELAQSHMLQPADPTLFETGNNGARQLVSSHRVENVVWSTARLGEANPVNHSSSWVLGANPDTTRLPSNIGSSQFTAQEAPYVSKPDGSVVPTFHTILLEHAMLSPDPNNPQHSSVRTRDLVFATPYDSNVQMSGSTTYIDPSKDMELVRKCALHSLLPGLQSQSSWAELADGDAQLKALRSLVDAGDVECIWRAGPSVLHRLGKVPGEVELTPNAKGLQQFGLFFVVMPVPAALVTQPPEVPPQQPYAAASAVQHSDAPPSHVSSAVLPPPHVGGKFFAVVASHPLLKGPHAKPTMAVQTITGNINCLRQLSGLAQIEPSTSPLWMRTVKARRVCVYNSRAY